MQPGGRGAGRSGPPLRTFPGRSPAGGSGIRWFFSWPFRRKFGDKTLEAVEADRFGEVIFEARLAAFVQVVFRAIPAERDAGEALAVMQPAHQLVAVQVWQTQVADD